MTTLLALITEQQNQFIDQAAERYKYNKEMQNAYMTQLCNSFDQHSSFYLGNTTWIVAGRIAQVALLSLSTSSAQMTATLKKLLEKLPSSNATFDIFKELFDPYYKSGEPFIESAKVMGQKKLEVLTQSDATERNKTDQLQQTIQNAKDVIAQLTRSLFNH